MAASAASPSIPGSWRSTSATSGASSPSAARPASAVPKDLASAPCRRRNVSMAEASPASSSMIITLRITLAPSGVSPRQDDGRAGPGAGALECEPRSRALEKLLGDREAQPRAAGLRGEERLEGPREGSRGHARPGIVHVEHDLTCRGHRGEAESAASWHGVECVPYETEQGFLEPCGVEPDLRKVGRELEHDTDSLRGAPRANRSQR